jgi:regulatory protein
MPEAPDTAAQLKARALRHLARREHSRAELARKLAPHAESPAALEAVLDELRSRKQLSDERFAEERARVLARKFGPARIRHDLKARGVSAHIVEGVAASLSAEAELERARGILERRYRVPAQSLEERARRARFLQGRGFSPDVVRRLLRSCEP